MAPGYEGIAGLGIEEVAQEAARKEPAAPIGGHPLHRLAPFALFGCLA
jgi:hypothetical protein